tara:strand:+ start:551 stop:751 length:201 start_codon:yes stop_codon:yes gene_type:complete
MSDNKEYTIAVWDLVFFRVDEDGNEELDEDGNIKIYDCEDYECSYLADGLEIEDLTPIKFTGGYER